MAGFLQRLESNEAVLLMYLADELPAAERAEVERRLASDPALRAALHDLRRLHAEVMDQLGSFEPAPPAAAEHRVRRVAREMRRYQIELMTRPTPAEPQTSAKAWPGWVYSASAVAAAVFLLISLWGFGLIELPSSQVAQHRPPVGFPSPYPDDDEVYPAIAGLAQSLEAEAVAWEPDEARVHMSALEDLSAGLTDEDDPWRTLVAFSTR